MSAKEMLDFVEKTYKEGNMPVWDYEKFKEEFKEKTAREMFEELGFYEQRVDDRYKNKIIMYSNSFAEVVITFYLDIKQIAIDSLKDGQGKRYELDYKIFQAINKQIEELGWK